MSNIVFEIFTEELPATLQKSIQSNYKQFIENELKTSNLQTSNGNIFIGITLNRIVLNIKNYQIDEEHFRKIVLRILSDFSKNFPRTMYYPQFELKWIRPIRNLFICVNNKIIIDNFYGITSSNGTFIKKFDFVQCKNCEEYFKCIEKEGIELDYYKRLSFIKDKVYKEDINYQNDSLLEEIAGMSEYCIEPMKCMLDKRFYNLPFELIELVLRENQRYVVFKQNINNEEISFLIFGDKITDDINKRSDIIKGHKKVVNARLDDALYYWNMDKKIKNNKTKLKTILSNKTFIDNIKWEDFLVEQEKIMEYLLNKNIKNNEIVNKNIILQLIWDTKLDLSTGVVEEFPELQGVIGEYYFGYNFNPYIINRQQFENIDTLMNKHSIGDIINIIYYYFVDRIAYIKLMYKQGKKPTGSGDKYKVKSRMDDVIFLLSLFKNNILKENFHENLITELLTNNDEIFKLFSKRLAMFIEEKYCNEALNIKKFSEICFQLIIEHYNIFSNIESYVVYIKDKDFTRTYKRIIGYTKDLEDLNNIQNDTILQKVKEILPDETKLSSINTYLDNNKINDNKITKYALRYIQEKHFKQKLPEKFLEML